MPKRTLKTIAAAAPRPRLTPPPGLSAAEALRRLPPPAKGFDAEAVEGIVDLRTARLRR
jgi:hypothetical protein